MNFIWLFAIENNTEQTWHLISHSSSKRCTVRTTKNIKYSMCNPPSGYLEAFESVHQEFLLHVLKRFNFSNEFRCKYLTTVEKVMLWIIEIQLNRSERAVFQGCPLSPYLFLLIIETMAPAIRQKKKKELEFLCYSRGF